MNIYTVRDNLKRTIEGKEQMLADLEIPAVTTPGNRMALETTAKFLVINIKELKSILADVEACCKQASDDSWTTNPDRMGGQFTDEEIRRSGEWR